MRNIYSYNTLHLRRLRREPGDDTGTITNTLESNVVVGTIVLLLLLLGLLLWSLSEHGVLRVCLLDESEPPAQAGHQVLLDVCMRHAVSAESLPYGGVRVGQGVADDVRAKGKVGVELSERGFDLLEVEGLESLGAALPLFDLCLHSGVASNRYSVAGRFSMVVTEVSLRKQLLDRSGVAAWRTPRHD